MGTKRPSCTLFDTSSNINMPDRKLQPGGKISRDPSPRPAMITQTERDREEDRRRERDKARYKDTDPRERPYDRSPAPRMREGDRERRGQADNRGRNGRPVSNLDRGAEREVERVAKKGDTFPRIRKGSPEQDRPVMSTTKVHEEKSESRQRDRPRRPEKDDWEREKAKTWQREQYNERERDEGRKGGGRPAEDEKARQRERYKGKISDASYQDRGREGGDSWDRRERDVVRKREKPRPNGGEREVRWSSPQKRRDRDRDRKDEAQRREGKRDTRSEGDSDERELRRERVREREELIYQHSKSEGDDKGNRPREKDPNSHTEDDRRRDRDRQREGDRSRQRSGEKDRREDDRQREDRVRRDDRTEDERYRQMRDRERKDRDSRWEDTAGGRRGEMLAPPRVPPRSKSSGEWSSDMDSEGGHRRGRDSNEERESGRESNRESERDTEEARAAERGQERGETQGRERGETAGVLPEQRRMWLEPQRGKEGRDEFKGRERDTRQRERSREERGYEGSQVELEREMQQVRVEPDEQQSRDRERQEFGREEEKREEGVSVDEEEVWRETDKGGKEYLSDSSGGTEKEWRRDAEGESTTDNIEESDREEGEGKSVYERQEGGGGGSESGRRPERDSMLSGEDGFVTVSSGGDDGEDEREEDEDEEFEDCQEFWEGGGQHGSSPSVCSKGREGGKDRVGERTMGWEGVDEEDQGSEKKPKFVYCVVGQTLPRSNPDGRSSSQVDVGGVGRVGRDEPTLEKCRHHSDEGHLTMSREHGNPITYSQNTEGQRAEVGVKFRSASEPPVSREDAQGMMIIEENPYDEIGGTKRDSQTERLLVTWREKNEAGMERVTEELSPTNPYGDVFPQTSFEQIRPILDELSAGAMSPEEVEAIRIRLSGAWSMSEEPKRHSQAPHLKWAKNVVREILGQTQEEGGASVGKMTTNERQLETELEEGEALEMEGLRGTGRSQADMHADHSTAMHGNGDTPTHTHADTQLNTDGKEDIRVDKEAEPSGLLQPEKAEIEVRIPGIEVRVTEKGGEEVTPSEAEEEKHRKKEVEMYLSVSNTLYKPNSCPILNYESDPGIPVPSTEGESQEEDEGREGDSEGEEDEDEEERQGKEPEEMKAGGGNEVDSKEEVKEADTKLGATRRSTCSFRDQGPEARIRRRGIRKTTERRKGGLVDVEEEEGVGRDRRTRIFSTTDDDNDCSKSWGEVELRNVLDTIDRRKRNSRFFNAAQLYQQYSEAAQNFEILRQARSDVVSVCEDSTVYSPAPSPPPARRPLPPLPPVPHPHSLSHACSLSSIRSLPIPERPRSQARPSSSRLSTSLTQTATLWRDLPGVRSSGELEDLSEDQRRLQEVRFEVVTSEASYCRSLDIVVEHFVKSKQLGALLATQDRNWLFSRLADVRAISHSFLSKLEERVETEIVHFTVCDIIARHCQRFKMVYVPYLTNQSYQDATYQRLMNENQGFKRIVEKLERSPVCQRLPLRSFLVLPFQRITRIKLLVQNIVKRTTPGTAEATQAIKAMRLLEKLIQESNDSITQMKSIESLVTLSAKVDFECRTLPLISQSRRLVREGPVTELMDFSLKDTERNIYMHLFTDYLLLSLQKEGGRFTVIDHSPVAELRAENCRVKLHSLQKNLFRLHMSTKALLLRTDTQSDKLRWISALSRPHPEIDFSAAQDFVQMQCIRAFIGQQPDELSLEKADIILVHQQSSDHWVEGTRLSDRHRGWVPESHLETITNSRVRQRNLSDAIKLTTATAAV